MQTQLSMTAPRYSVHSSPIPEYFKYGIRYVPAPETEDVFRTVRIGNLPQGVELRDVLARVRGGRVVSVRLLDTGTKALGGGMTALVVFVNQVDAEAYVEWGMGEEGVVFYCGDEDEEGVKARVSLIPTPTFPLSEFQRRNIFQENRTRILTVRCFPKSISLQRLESDIARTGRLGALCEWYLDGDETLWLEFAGIESAGTVYGLLRGRGEYRDLEVGFGRDRCERGVEELKGRGERRRPRPMFPRWGEEEGLRDERQRKRVDGDADGDVDIVGSTLALQRRRLAALRNQQVLIPRCMGEGLKSSSWADEVIEYAGETVVDEDEDDVRGRPGFPSGRLERPLKFRRREVSKPEIFHPSEASTSPSLEPTSDADFEDEPTPTGPVRKQRILTAKEYLLEHPSSSFPSPATPSQPELKPQPQSLTLTIPSPSNPSPSNSNPAHPDCSSPLSAESAEYSLHSYGSSQPSASDPRPSFPLCFPTLLRPTTTEGGMGADGFIPITMDMDTGRDMATDIVTAADTATLQARNTTTNTATLQPLHYQPPEKADTQIYFGVGDAENAILESEKGESSENLPGVVDSGDVLRGEKGGEEVKKMKMEMMKMEMMKMEMKMEMKMKMEVKINPDEIVLEGDD
jgi:hypothetical protein